MPSIGEVTVIGSSTMGSAASTLEPMLARASSGDRYLVLLYERLSEIDDLPMWVARYLLKGLYTVMADGSMVFIYNPDSEHKERH